MHQSIPRKWLRNDLRRKFSSFPVQRRQLFIIIDN